MKRFLPSILKVVVFGQDAMLFREFVGYPDYARRVRFKLLPGLW